MEELENYSKDKLTINLVWANIFGILILIPILIIFGFPYYWIWKDGFSIQAIINGINPVNMAITGLYCYGLIILGIIVHELIHGIIWAKFAKQGFKSIKFGVLWKILTPYCHCKEPLTVRQYIIGAIAPAIVLGLLPAIIAITIGNIGMLIFGVFFTMAAGGDFLIINLIIKENKNDLVQDHPSECGCYIYRKL